MRPKETAKSLVCVVEAMSSSCAGCAGFLSMFESDFRLSGVALRGRLTAARQRHSYLTIETRTYRRPKVHSPSVAWAGAIAEAHAGLPSPKRNHTIRLQVPSYRFERCREHLLRIRRVSMSVRRLQGQITRRAACEHHPLALSCNPLP